MGFGWKRDHIRVSQPISLLISRLIPFLTETGKPLTEDKRVSSWSEKSTGLQRNDKVKSLKLRL